MSCIRYAAAEYRVPQLLLMAIRKVEGGKSGFSSRNKNGTNDYGVMQINTVWMNHFKKIGVSNPEHFLTHDTCYNIRAGAWILKTELSQEGDFWKKVGNYHSRTNRHNSAYQWRVYRAMLNLSKTGWR